MRRREFITLLGGTAASWPLAVRAQQAGMLATIGFLGADASAFSPWTAAFVARLRELGWVEGSTIAIEYRWSQGRTERYAEIAAEFVRLKDNVGNAQPVLEWADKVRACHQSHDRQGARPDDPAVTAAAHRRRHPVGDGRVAELRPRTRPQ
jgi:hypothetical protein